MKYYFDPTRINPSNSSQGKITALVGQNKKVLEVGCAYGNTSQCLIKNGCSVVGVELDPALAAEASKICHKVILGNIEDELTLNQIDGQFEVIILADILEHLKDPWATLKRLRQFLKDDGYILISLPNAAHWSVRFGILKGAFDYQEEGLLDKTHLRFFTLKTAQELIEQASYQIVFQDIVYNNHASGVFGAILRLLGPKIELFLAKVFPGLFAFQFIFKVRK